MKIGIIGSGVSGMVAARLLAAEHDVCLFEAAGYPGGHAHTARVAAFGESYSVDTGFMVFNDRTYPNFCQLLQWLGVKSQPSDMSFSVACERTGLEYQGSSLSGLFAQRSNLVHADFYRLLADILRFHRNSTDFLDQGGDDSVSTAAFLSRHGYGPLFRNQYLLPMAAAIWSSPSHAINDFPAVFLLSFMRNHGLLQLRNRPQWKTIVGGSCEYVRRLVEPLGSRLRLNTPIHSVARHRDHVVVRHEGGVELFDAVVMATHSDTALSLLADADATEAQILNAIPYHKNDVVLHTDIRQLPDRRQAWASWNYRVARSDERPASVTYDLSRLQRLRSRSPILVTLNPVRKIATDCVLARYRYSHPAFSQRSMAAQRRWREIDGKRRTHFCGAYWGYGFHEDGVRSALAVTRKFGIGLDPCGAVSTKDTSHTAERSR